MLVSGHRKDCPPVSWSEARVLLRVASVTFANDEFPKAGYLQLILALHIWELLQPLTKENLGFLQRGVLGAHLYQQKWDWGTGS